MFGSNAPGNEFRGIQRIVQGVWAGALGGLGGAVLGSAWRTENWMPVTLPRAPVASNRRSINDNHARCCGR